MDPDSGSDLVSSLAADLLSCPLQDVQLPEAQDGVRVQTVLAAGFEFWLLGLKRRSKCSDEKGTTHL